LDVERAQPWFMPAVRTALCVLPLTALGALVTDRACYHLQGNPGEAEPGTPRGRWCATVEPGHHWWALLTFPLLAAFVLVALLSLVPRLRVTQMRVAVGCLVCLLVILQIRQVGSLAPAYEGP
jgi:hypothetical protein